MTLLLRDLNGMAEFRLAEDLQRAVWGAGDQPDPADLMMVIQAEGGLCGGAFRDGLLLGYVFAFPTATPGVQHSHRLAVSEAARGLGLGVRLKLYQRDWCLARGIPLVRWTFDPLRATNASLNIQRLGASVGTYLPDYYGAMEGINAGLPSDRLMADWHLASPVAAAMAEGRTRPDIPARRLDLPLPESLDAMMETAPEAALHLRLALRAALTEAFARGERITGFDRDSRCYLLSPAD